MSESLKRAAEVLARAKRLGAHYQVSSLELGNPYYQREILSHQAHAFAAKLAEGLEPSVEEFVTNERDLDGFGVQYRAEMVVLTRAQFNEICRAVNTAIRLEALRSPEVQP